VFPADEGSIRVRGKDVKIRSIQDALKNSIVYLPEDRLTEGLCLPQSIIRNITVATLRQYRKHGLLDKEKMKSVANSWVKTFLSHI
jgi:simple sugar transport system ATP-binding protein